MDCSSISGGSGMQQAGMAAPTMQSGAQQAPPPPPAADSAARAQGMAAEGKGQNLNAVA